MVRRTGAVKGCFIGRLAALRADQGMSANVCGRPRLNFLQEKASDLISIP